MRRQQEPEEGKDGQTRMRHTDHPSLPHGQVPQQATDTIRLDDLSGRVTEEN